MHRRNRRHHCSLDPGLIRSVDMVPHPSATGRVEADRANVTGFGEIACRIQGAGDVGAAGLIIRRATRVAPVGSGEGIDDHATGDRNVGIVQQPGDGSQIDVRLLVEPVIFRNIINVVAEGQDREVQYRSRT